MSWGGGAGAWGAASGWGTGVAQTGWSQPPKPPPQPAKGAAKGAVAQRPGLLSVGSNLTIGGRPQMPGIQAQPGMTASQQEAKGQLAKTKLAKYTADIITLENGLKPVTEVATKTVENENAIPAAIKAATENLEKQQKKVNDTKTEIIKGVAEARGGGPAAMIAANDMQKLLIKCSSFAQQIIIGINKLKPKLAKAEVAAEAKAKEAKDATLFKALLTKANTDVNTAVNSVNAVGKQVDPLVLKPPDEGPARDEKLAKIEKSAEEAGTKCENARKELTEKLKTILAYAPETKKKAQADLGELQKKLHETIRKCNTFKAFKKEFPKLVENQKAVVETTEKLAGHESAITKATKISEGKTLTTANIKAIDDLVEPVQKAVKEATATIAIKSRGCDASTQEKFTKLSTRGAELTKKIAAVMEKIKPQRDKIKSEEAVADVNEKFGAIEEAWAACQKAEMPFLTGLEILPGEVNEKALKASLDATTAATKAIGDCRSCANSGINKAKTYEKELGTKTTEALKKVLAEVQVLDAKVSVFRKETAERRVTFTVSEVMIPFETSVKAAVNAGKVLAEDGLEDKASDAITKEIETCKEALAEANKASQEANKNQRDKKPDQAALRQIQQETKVCQDKLNKLKSSILLAEKILKAKAAMPESEAALKEAEKTVKAAQKLVPKEGKGLSMEQIKALDEACLAATKAIGAAGAKFTEFIAVSAPKTKESVQKLVERKNAANASVKKVKEDTKARRDETFASHILEEAEAKTKAAEEASEKLNSAEAPFLAGAELDLTKTRELIAKCEEAAKATQEALTAAQSHSSQKLAEAKQFAEESATKVKEGLAAMRERTSTAVARLSTFRKDNTQRTKDAKVVEAQGKVDEMDAAIKKGLATLAPFEKDGADNMSEEKAAAPLEKFTEAEKEAQSKINACRNILNDCQREQKGNESQMETLKKLQDHLLDVQKDWLEKKKVTATHQQKALGTKLLTESKTEVAGLDAEVKKAKDASEKLVADGGETFLTDACVQVLVKALQEHMKEKDLTEDGLFKEAGGKKMKETDFVKYMSSLPEKIAHDELSAFPESRAVEMFKALAADGKALTQADFKAMFVQKKRCVKEIAMTNQFDVEAAETLCKIEADSVVELTGPLKEDEKSGMIRSECKFDGKTGWVTVSQKKGGLFLVNKPSAFSLYCTEAEKVIKAAESKISKAAGSLNAKIGQASRGEDGSKLKEAKEEMVKLKDTVSKAQKESREISNEFYKAKTGYSSKEKEMLNAHIAARNQKEAAPFVDGPKAKMAGVEAAAQAVQDAGAEMQKLSGEELEAFAKPASALEAVEKHTTVFEEKIKEVREAVKEQQTALNEVKPKTGGTAEAAKQLAGINSQMGALSSKTKSVLPQLKAKCFQLVKGKMDPTAEGLRKHCSTKGKSPEALFDSLKKGDKIPEAAFCKLLQSLDDPKINAEHAKLITRKLEADGVSKETFTKYIVVYYKVAKTIAFTDGLDIGKCKTLRKAAEGEIIECLQGPTTVEYEGSEMSRIRGRTTGKDGKVTEGWLTVSGSKGTPFLEKCNKPPEKK